jgi:hypothetical protein
LKKDKILISEVYKGKPFNAGGNVAGKVKPEEELERLLMSRNVSNLPLEKRNTLSMSKKKTISSPDFTAHLLRQV